MVHPYEILWQRLQQTYPHEHQVLELMHAVAAAAAAAGTEAATAATEEAWRFWQRRLEEVRGQVIERSMLLQMR